MRGRLFTSCYPRSRSGAGRTPFHIFHIKRDTTTTGKQDAVVVITWKHPDRHARTLVKDWLKDGVRRPGVYLDMDTMWRDLDSFLRRMTRRLHQERKFARQVAKRGRRLDQKYTVRPENADSRIAWQKVWESVLHERRLPAD
jgi:hypothetical protein